MKPACEPNPTNQPNVRNWSLWTAANGGRPRAFATNIHHWALAAMHHTVDMIRLLLRIYDEATDVLGVFVVVFFACNTESCALYRVEGRHRKLFPRTGLRTGQDQKKARHACGAAGLCSSAMVRGLAFVALALFVEVTGLRAHHASCSCALHRGSVLRSNVLLTCCFCFMRLMTCFHRGGALTRAPCPDSDDHRDVRRDCWQNRQRVALRLMGFR